MRVLIIGGTRFIGPSVVNQLLAAGHQLCLFHRTPNGRADVQHIEGDRHRLANYTTAFRKFAPDVVLDMIPITEQEAADVMRVFKGIAKRVVSISSQDVYRAYGRVNGTEPGPPDRVPLTEDAPLRAKLFPYRGETPRTSDDPRRILDDYEKILVERVTLSDDDLPGTVLRLPMVYGPRDYQHRLYQFLKRMDDNRPAILLNEQMAHWRWTRDYVENTAAAIALTVSDAQAAGRTYNVGDMPALSTADWIRVVAEAAGWFGEIITAPDYQLPEEMRSQAGLEQDLVTDSSRIRNELGYIPPIPQEEGLRRTVEWERKNPPEQVDQTLFDYATEDAILARLR